MFEGKRIDFHSHILPNMDDGSTSLEMSLQMLQRMEEQGVCCVVATPHFYATKDNPSHFLNKRKARLAELQKGRNTRIPLVIAGAEVQYFEGITVMEELPYMRIEDTPGLLLEMPFCTWSDRMLEDILTIQDRADFRVILAHIERYIRYQKEGTIEMLVRHGVMIQSNASFFLERQTSRRAMQLLEQNCIHLLGSDCHNLTTRPPNVGAAYDLIGKKCGYKAVKSILSHGLALLMTNTNDTTMERTRSEKEMV